MSDITGRRQFAKNFIVSWGMHGFILAAGFIVPRQISDNLGPEALGVWDLGWITLRYLSMSKLGVATSLMRYVALYRAENDFESISKATTAVFVWQACIALFSALASLLIAWGLVLWIDLDGVQQQEELRNVISLMGFSLALQMLAAPTGGILTGCHRWDIQYSLNAGHDFGLAMVLILVLMMGGGLVDLAWTVVGAAAVIGLIRVYFARRELPEVRIRPSLWDSKIAMKMLSFGAKASLTQVPHFIVFQIPTVLLAGLVSPAALAVYNRSLGLVKQCHTLTSKVNRMFTPITSSLVGLDKKEEARAQLIKVSSYSMALMLPIALGLICYGDIVLLIWMGEGYDNWALLTILVCGAVLPMAQDGVVSVLAGLNAIGRLAVATTLVTAIVMTLAVAIVNAIGWSVTAAAAVTAVSWTAGRGLVIPYYLYKHFNISILRYLSGGIFFPLMCCIPLGLSLAFGRYLLNEEHWVGMLISWAIGGAITLPIYWYWLVPEALRSSVLKRISKKREDKRGDDNLSEQNSPL